MEKHEELSIHMSKCYVKLIMNNLLYSITSAKANNINVSVLNKLINIYGTLELLNQDLLQSMPKSDYKTINTDKMYSLINEHINSYLTIKIQNDYLLFGNKESLKIFGKGAKDSLNNSKKLKVKTKRKITMLFKEALNDS